MAGIEAVGVAIHGHAAAAVLQQAQNARLARRVRPRVPRHPYRHAAFSAIESDIWDMPTPSVPGIHRATFCITSTLDCVQVWLNICELKTEEVRTLH